MRACSLGNHTLPRSVMNSARSKPAEPLMEKDKGGCGGGEGGKGGGLGEAILNVRQTLTYRHVLFPMFSTDTDNNCSDTWKRRLPIKAPHLATGVASPRFARHRSESKCQPWAFYEAQKCRGRSLREKVQCLEGHRHSEVSAHVPAALC